jgi:RHH-type proline utilization regulon transcriptional repressor/proline dehydrogenase/delta 1-pyrroline-5-carboxylate dehydrogenase
MKLNVTTVVNGHWLNLSLEELFETISAFYSIEEITYIKQLYTLAYDKDDKEEKRIQELAQNTIKQIRSNPENRFFDLEELLQEYSLSDEDGVTLMCLAEAMLRIPDKATADALIQDKLNDGDWKSHFKKDNSLFVNASTWGLMVASGIAGISDNSISKLFKHTTKPVIRSAVEKAMRIMGQHFVLGRSIKEAMKNAKPYLKKGYDYSYDMLGESAITKTEAKRYYDSYYNAILEIEKNSKSSNIMPSLSIKLSALYPRLEETHRKSVLNHLTQRIIYLVKTGKEHNVGITIDAEEADRLELTLSLFQAVFKEDFIRNWGKFGLVVQAYSKRALPALCWLTKLAKSYGDEIPVRLVKGAYWDSEIKHSQQLGLSDYPVFTRKEYTDTAYLACARYLLSDVTKGAIYPQFASHNAHTISSIRVMADNDREFEFQRLHGMGDDLYDTVISSNDRTKVRIYAPVGSHEDLLPYLVRRLLENGANSSFVHQLSDEKISIDELVKRPLPRNEINDTKNYAIPRPKNMFRDRKNSHGVNLSSLISREKFMNSLIPFKEKQWIASPLIGEKNVKNDDKVVVYAPYDNKKIVGEYCQTSSDDALNAISIANLAFNHWSNTPVKNRADILRRAADLLERNQNELIALCQFEAGKTIQDSVDEIREAVDFCRYYAQQAEEHFTNPITLPGPTGESNLLSSEGRGVFVCISPWNFPLAIFIGQITAALVTGNTVIAKPAETTSLIAYRAVEILHQAGIPKDVLHFTPGSGASLGKILNSNERIAGVVFTGSNTTARIINQTLANRSENAGIATLIAETGGLNAMIVDSTALPEQAAKDIISSAFSSAGQRCSALRVLYLQADIADRVIDLIKGMMEELIIGDPHNIDTDIGPVIDTKAQLKLNGYIEKKKQNCNSWFNVDLPENCKIGTFVAPTLLEVDSISELTEEQFGPILHIVKYKAEEIDTIIEDINGKHYGLTLGIQTRNITLYKKISKQMKVGNIYINRNQIGAVVGVNPFGGCGLSGTGPKAGGPNYLRRFITEKTITNNTTAIGGNIDLLTATNEV